MTIEEICDEIGECTVSNPRNATENEVKKMIMMNAINSDFDLFN